MTRTHPMHDYYARIAGDRTCIVRTAAIEDIPVIVSIHQKAFRHFFLNRLGGEFLRRYYGLVLTYSAGIALVGEVSGVVEGFACGFVDPSEFYRLMKKKGRIFVAPSLSALLRDPSLATKVLNGVRRIEAMASQGHARSCELSSIAVAPEAGSNGLGHALVNGFLEQAWSMDAESVFLTTDADGNDVANAFYRKAGFKHTRRFLQRKGRWMNEYVITRVEPPENGELP